MVEKWAKENPCKTRQDVFLEQWPKVSTYDEVIDIPPCTLDKTIRVEVEGDCRKGCDECRREFWMQEIE